MTGYGQFCPVALAAEIVTKRWTPLVIRELLCGSTRFNEIRRGVPKMSPSLLSRRLDELEEHGLVRRKPGEDHGHEEYHLTEAGRQLRPVIEGLGRWGQRWFRGEWSEDELDAELLMWDVHRRIETERTPPGRTVVRFHFAEEPEETRSFWLVVDPDEVDLCRKDPGHRTDLEVRTALRTMTEIWMGRIRFGEALERGEIQLRGPTALRRSFPDWLGLNLFADVPAPGDESPTRAGAAVQ